MGAAAENDDLHSSQGIGPEGSVSLIGVTGGHFASRRAGRPRLARPIAASVTLCLLLPGAQRLRKHSRSQQADEAVSATRSGAAISAANGSGGALSLPPGLAAGLARRGAYRQSWDSLQLHIDLTTLRGRRVLILGDLMLDEYLWGDVRRISPEAPVPVVEVRRRSRTPGGAANVAANVAALGGYAVVIGVIGDDDPGRALRQLLADRGVDPGALIVAERPTTTKSRVIAHQQQMLRFDHEDNAALDGETEDRLFAVLTERIADAEVCVISDYAKGVVSARLAERAIALANRLAKPVVVDPKSRDFRRYRRASVVTPNLFEACAAAGIDAHSQPAIPVIGRELLERLEGGALLITRGADGMSLFTPSGGELHIPSVARSVFDVTGAGDTMVGTLAVALAAGHELETAARLANTAAGLVVGHFGTSTVSLEEIGEALKAPE